MIKEINFDMDGTITNLYGVSGWLDDIIAENPRPYAEAKPLINMSAFARKVNALQKKGYKIKIISWLAKDSTREYDIKVVKAKENWLKKHLPSVKWDEINIIPYGTPKNTYGNGILFDDEERNRKEWNGIAYGVENILKNLAEVA